MENSEQMKACRDIPKGYTLFWSFDISKPKETVNLSFWGLMIAIVSWFGFLALARSLHPAIFPRGSFQISISILSSLIFIAEVLIISILMIIIHEGFHGIFFWIFSGERPKFAFKIYYAYASAPGWYFPRWQYFYTALAPLIGITLIGVAALLWLPAYCAMPALMLLVFNTSGAVGDIWVALRLVICPRSTLVRDYGDKIEFFKPAPSLLNQD
jgi:hypothetical protein